MPYGAIWKLGPKSTPSHPNLFRPRYQDWGSHDKRPHWDTTLDLFEPWPIKKGSSSFPPKQRTAKSPQGRANRMLKPDFPKKGMGKEKWKERKGRNGKKEKRKKRDENKEKSRRKERRIPDQWLKRSEKGKEASLDQWKKEDINSSSQIATQNHSWLAISHPTWTKRKKPKHPASSPKNSIFEKILLVRDRTFDLWFDRKSCAKWSHGAVMVWE